MPVEINPLLSAEFIKNPLPHLMAAWSKAPIARHDNITTTHSVFAYDDVKSVLINHEVYGSEMSQEQKDMAVGALLDNLIAVDPPRHTRLRMIANKAFIPPVIANYADATKALVDRLLDECLDKGEFNVIDDFAAQITVGMITNILGLPASDWPQIREWTTDISLNLMADLWLKERDPAREASTARVISELVDYFSDYIDERKRSPIEGDLISLFMSTEVDGERLSDDEVKGTAMLLLLAGNETTTNLIANYTRSCAWYPDQFGMTRDNPSLSRQMLEEVLRMTPSLRGTARRVRKDTELHGQEIKKGDAVFAWIESANRDPNQFDDPNKFDLLRKPNRHIAFAAGPHICLGAPLARLEGRTVAHTFAERISSVELIGEADVAQNAIMNNILKQNVRLTAV